MNTLHCSSAKTWKPAYGSVRMVVAGGGRVQCDCRRIWCPGDPVGTSTGGVYADRCRGGIHPNPIHTLLR